MVQSKATTIKEYLDWLPEDRRKEISKVRSIIRKHLPKGYEETITYGMIADQVPKKTLPDTYNGQPLCYAALAAQKNFNTLYLMGAYGSARLKADLQKAFDRAGLRLDMGKSCVRFKTANDLPLPAIGKVIAAVPPAKYVQIYEKSRARK
jgi:hypothetical protein